jgi:hypothetical protein
LTTTSEINGEHSMSFSQNSLARRHHRQSICGPEQALAVSARLRSNGRRSDKTRSPALLEFSPDQESDGTTKFVEGNVVALGHDAKRGTLVVREAIAAAGFDLFVGVNDFCAPTRAVAHTRVWIVSLPATRR